MAEIHAQTPMGEINIAYPGARRALFAKYHIGGCSSCSYQETESLLGVCDRNKINIEDAIDHILKSHEIEQSMLISPKEVKQMLDEDKELKLIDTRTREEFDAVHIEGSSFMTQESQQEIFAKWNPDTLIVLIDHTGKNALDTCAWFIGHEMKNTRALHGGIDAWSQQIDSSVSRYRLEM